MRKLRVCLLFGVDHNEFRVCSLEFRADADRRLV
jgi:hypothetical protein